MKFTLVYLNGIEVYWLMPLKFILICLGKTACFLLKGHKMFEDLGPVIYLRYIPEQHWEYAGGGAHQRSAWYVGETQDLSVRYSRYGYDGEELEQVVATFPACWEKHIRRYQEGEFQTFCEAFGLPMKSSSNRTGDPDYVITHWDRVVRCMSERDDEGV